MPIRQRAIATIGIFLLIVSAYAVVGPGRIDIIDGQYRFEVAKNILEARSIQIMDPYLDFAAEGINGMYSPYNISGSLVALPLVAFARLTGGGSIDRQQFFFSFTSAFLGAATAAVLFLFYLELDVEPRRALVWTFVAAFATLAFPAATSVFDQTQHGFFVICACFAAYLSGRRDSMLFAVLAGLSLFVLVNFQETYAFFIPTLAIAAVAPPGATPSDRRRSFERAAVIVFVAIFGLLLWGAINEYRFDNFFFSGKQNPNHPPALGNPLLGVPGLLVSPGKSIFLYSPPTAICLFGFRRLFQRERRLVQAVVLASLLYFGMISSLSFFGGDWCWGPRYFATILPLLALGFPFVAAVKRAARIAIRSAIVAGLCVQVLALSLDQHRFFYGHSLPTFFWYRHSTYYFSHSALFSRPFEIIDSIRHGVPAEAEAFRPGPYPDELTYAVFGMWGHPELPAPVWMRLYSVFWLPRPWPLWMSTIPPSDRPIDLVFALAVIGLTAACGALAIRYALPARVRPVRTQPASS